MSNEMRRGATPTRLMRCLLLCLLTTSFAVAGFAVGDPAEQVIVKSPNDKRYYAYFVLPNKLQVVLISDPDTDKAAAALDVAVGASSQPDNRQGLAHFLEHMLFLGTEKYPTAGEYQDFITTHGGTHNAYTAFENTNYFFEIDKDFLEPALDRFSQFFVSPMFNSEYVSREKNSVHSEYQARLKNDRRRTYSVMQQITNPAHPFSKFNVGSLDTLADRDGNSVRSELLKFYQRYYSANLMTLVVLGKEPLPILRNWATEKFSDVQNRNTQIQPTREALFRPNTLPARVNVLPITEQRTVMMSFPLPPVQEHYLSGPVEYVANILGHEGRASLLSLLKNRGWADSLSAGLGLDNRDNAALAITIALTTQGLDHVDDITTLVFSALRLIESKGIESWRFEEQQRLNDIAFRFKQKMPTVDYVSSIASDLHYFPAADVLRGPYHLEKFDPQLIRRFLGYVTPDNVLVTLIAQGLPTDRSDPWYATPYRVTAIDKELLRRWRTERTATLLALPVRNVFIPKLLDVKRAETPPSATPLRITQQLGYELWHKQDTSFAQPRADFFVSVRSPSANDSAVHSVLTEQLVRTVKDNLTEYTYPALLAGLDYELYQHIRGFTVRVSGYDDKQSELLKRIFDTLRKPVIDKQRFAALKDDLQRSLNNVKEAPPYDQTTKEIRNLLVKPYWTIEQRLAALPAVTPDSLRGFLPRLYAQIYVIALSHGNVTQEESLNLGTLVQHSLIGAAKPTQVAPGRVVKLQSGDNYIRELNISHPDSALSVYFQGTDKSPRTRANFEILGQLISSPFYNDLRTDKQLGYVVFSGSSPYLEVPGMLGIVQSPIADPGALETHITAFVEGFGERLSSVSAETFDQHKHGLISRLLKADDRLRTRSNRYWRELDMQHYGFDSREKLAAAIDAVAQTDFNRFYNTALLDESRKRLRVQAVGTNHREAARQIPGGELIESPEKFGNDGDYFPVREGLPTARAEANAIAAERAAEDVVELSTLSQNGTPENVLKGHR